MEYIKSIWLHQKTEYPVIIYMEIDDDRYETRKIEIYKNKVGLASQELEYGDTWLSEKPIPGIEEINKDHEFLALKISNEEFEIVWKDINKQIHQRHEKEHWE